MNAASQRGENGSRPIEKMETRFLAIAFWIPLVAFSALGGFATIARIRVGHWPYYSNPDPKDLNLPFFHVAALVSYPVALVSVPLGLLLVVLAWDTLRRRDVAVFALGSALWAFFLPTTGRLFEWLID